MRTSFGGCSQGKYPLFFGVSAAPIRAEDTHHSPRTQAHSPFSPPQPFPKEEPMLMALQPDASLHHQTQAHLTAVAPKDQPRAHPHPLLPSPICFASWVPPNCKQAFEAK